MEAFYETGGHADIISESLFSIDRAKIENLYEQLSEMINRFNLVSFACSHKDLPLWAYYASNFAGICLEFDTNRLFLGDFQNEKLREVIYSKDPLPPISVFDMLQEKSIEVVLSRLTRKRIEWAHEKEWRFITGKYGPKYYLDDALVRIYLGPKIKEEHRQLICSILDRRPVEILSGEINGFSLSFKTIKAPLALDECERVGKNLFDYENDLYAENEIKKILTVPWDDFVKKCAKIVKNPNMEQFAGIDVSGNMENTIYMWTTYKLRSGQNITQKRYYDCNGDLINLPADC